MSSEDKSNLLMESPAMNEQLRNSSLLSYLPNFLTILALCAGITSLRYAIDCRYENAIFLVLCAAILDGFDGRVARLLNASSSYGLQLDSLADFMNFGVAPCIILYSYLLHDLYRLGWIAALGYSIACCMRLARFNASADQPRAFWQKNYFEGVPAPAGALLVLLPLYLGQLGVHFSRVTLIIAFAYTIVISYLLVSRIPLWNGKNLAIKLRRDVIVVLILSCVIYIAFIASYPWETLALSSVLYLLFIPISAIRYNVTKNKLCKSFNEKNQR